jgi:phosphohistidine swiveling domain-containing protein
MDFSIDEQFFVSSTPRDRFPVYTRANVGENWPGPITLLTYSTTGGPSLEAAWRKAVVRFGAFSHDEFAHDDFEMIGVFYGYPFLNLSVQRVFGVRMPGANAEMMDAAFFGAGSEGVPPYVADPRDVSPEHESRINEAIARLMTVEHLPELDSYRDDAARWRADRPDLSRLTNEELFQYAEPFLTDRFDRGLEELMFMIQAASVAIGMVQSAAERAGDPGLATRAISGLGDVDSAAPTFAMWDMSRLISGSETLTREFDAGVEGLAERLRSSKETDARTFVEEFDNFLYQYGSRCSNEYELAELSWESRPIMPLGFMERMRLQDETASPALGASRLRADRMAVEGQLLEALDAASREQLRSALNAAFVYLAGRERAKTAIIRVLHEARMALQEIGRRMVSAGHLEEMGHFNMLLHHEFPKWLEDPAGWAPEIVRRRRWYEALDELEPPFVTAGVPSPPSTWPKRRVEQFSAVTTGEVLAGIGVCPGSATGIARVIHDPSEAGDLEPGEVLVAPATDPMWTPLFVSAVAVVVDVGAPLSHAAIVSRELGIPCVVSAPHASRRIPNGARITVDGTTGTVTVNSV